jgi:SAM-dependent methyltransferase
VGAAVVLRSDKGTVLSLDPDRWHGAVSGAEAQLLAAIEGPVLDVGCGPGRLLVDLGRRGVAALGIDPAPGAAASARRRGGTVLQRSVFDPLPGEGRWMTVLLMDGNIGIGGNPVRLLRRCRELADPLGAVVVEIHGPGAGVQPHRARLERDGAAGPWFSWAEVGADAIEDLAGSAGLVVTRMDESRLERRWFATLRRRARTDDVG